jgi:CheY-like chemotaxis protein
MASKGTVLVVEDEHDIRVCLRESLEAEGYFVVSAANGASGLELLSNMTLPSVILLDVNMPIMTGDQFLSALLANDKLRSIPVIQISAGQTPQMHGVKLALKKPLNLDDLLAAVARCRAA